MKALQFQRLVGTLLEMHYGLALNDTSFAEDYPDGLEQGERLFPLINAYATKYDLQHISPSVKRAAALTVYDEIDAFARCYPTPLLNEQPTTCPCCGGRTEIEEVGSTYQLHDCLNPHCDYVFVTEFDGLGNW